MDVQARQAFTLKRPGKHKYELKLLRHADRCGEIERVAKALSAVPEGEDPSVELLIEAGLCESEALRACAHPCALPQISMWSHRAQPCIV